MCKKTNLKIEHKLIPVPDGVNPKSHISVIKTEIVGSKIHGIDKQVNAMESIFYDALKTNKKKLEVVVVAGPQKLNGVRKLLAFSCS